MTERPPANEHVAEIAKAHGWVKRATHTKVDAYQRGDESITFSWNDDGRSAWCVVHNGKVLNSPLALVSARQILETPAK